MSELRIVHGWHVLACPPDGTTVSGEHDAMDLIADALYQGADLVVVPVERLSDDFFVLRSRVAGEIVQKFANYRLRLAVVGDISAYEGRSTALRDFVYETNRGEQFWLLPTTAELDERLRLRARPHAGRAGTS
jgi:hypothetical protein